MRVVTARAVLFLRESRLSRATRRVVCFPCVAFFFPRGRIDVGTTELFAALPAPALAAAAALVEFPTIVQAAREDVIARRTFERPLPAPRALFGLHGFLISS